MITLTLKECNALSPEPVDFVGPETVRRNHNINAIYELIDIIEDDDAFSALLNYGNAKAPQILRDYYYKYLSNGKSVKDGKILNEVYNEYMNLSEKVRNFADRWSLDSGYVQNELISNDLLIYSFVKDPGRQTLHQHIAGEYIESIPIVENFKELPSGGKNALYLLGGTVITGEQKGNAKTGKSIDFAWEYTFAGQTLSFYATHKHTKASGGSQDNQYKDVQEYLENARFCIDPNVVLLSITDGPYYLNKETSVSNDITKLEYLNQRYRGERNVITTTPSLVEDVVPLIIKWLKEVVSPLGDYDSDIGQELQKLEIIKSKYKF